MTRTIHHHLDAATLMSYSAGSLGEALSAVAAAHIEMCPVCQRELKSLDLLGGMLFDRIDQGTAAGKTSVPGRPTGDVVTLAARRGEASGAVARPRQPAISRRYGLDLDNIAWRRLGPGIWHYRLPLSKGAKGDLRLIKVGAGRRMPEHGHGGIELTLVLSGAYEDETGRYLCGDIQDIDGEGEHQPVADASEGCVCLIASERPAKFKSLVGRLLQPLTGM